MILERAYLNRKRVVSVVKKDICATLSLTERAFARTGIFQTLYHNITI